MSAIRIHPLTGAPRNGKPRSELLSLLTRSSAHRRRPQLEATYDAARDSDEFKNYWANADRHDADSANSQAVRAKLVARSRYEVGNNGYADGIVQTLANYLVSRGPKLRMQTRLPLFNQAVERLWEHWAKAVQLRRKLWCMAHAKIQDGEALGVKATNPSVRDRVQLDLLLFETEQCQTPFLPFDAAGYIDGIRFDEFGNALWYDVLPAHPGGRQVLALQEPQRIPADAMLHWFKLRRPGQHRAVPEFSSTLNVGAASRRFREATLAAAESAADIAILLRTAFQPDELDQVAPLSTIEFQKRMMTALPHGWSGEQIKAEHPNQTYEGFLRAQLSESGRPKCVPYNLAACDSSTYSFASGKLDHLSFFGMIDLEREDANDLVLDPLFATWWSEAASAYRFNPGNGQSPAHTWDWPRHPVADVVAEANSSDTKLKNGSTTLSRVYADAGLDFEDELEVMAADYGVTDSEMRRILRQTIFSGAAPMPPALAPEPETAGAAADA